MADLDAQTHKEVLELLAKREEARIAVRDAEVELQKKRAEVSKLAAEIIRKDSSGVYAARVARW